MSLLRISLSGSVILALLAMLTGAVALAADEVLDDFEDVSGWTATSSEGARVELASDSGRNGMALRIDFDLGSGGWVIARKAISISLPANYVFKLALRGDTPPNNFELKLIDRSNNNVWWYKQRAFSFPSEWHDITVKKPRIQFAWGPAGGGAPKQVAYVELAITAAKGGKGSVWIDDFRLEPRESPPRSEPKPKVSASTSAPGHEPELILDQDGDTTWRSGAIAANQWVLVDLVRRREYGGLVIDWDPDDYATAYKIEVSDDGETWSTAYSSSSGGGNRDYIYLPDAESRYFRLDLEQSSRGQGYGIRSLTIKPFEFSASPNQFFETIAREAPEGAYPKYFSGRQTYWTVVGVNGDGQEALINEEGTVEVEPDSFSIEPFLYVDGTLIDWSNVRTTQELAKGYLPIPSVTWERDGLTLRITAFATGPTEASTLYLRYRVDNGTDAHKNMTLFVGLRPFQVLPPWQSLNMIGGVTAIRDLAFNARTVWVNREKAVLSLTPPVRFGASSFEDGALATFLQQGKTPPWTQVSDPFGYASGALQYDLTLAAGSHDEVYLAVPFHDPDVAAARIGTEGASSHFDEQLADITRYWQTLLDHVDLQLSPAADKVVRTLKSTLAYIMINRDGAAIRPGSRNYARSWIRDGAITSAALLEMGFPGEVRDFIRWYVGYQLPSGKIPCCVDHRGADSVSEHDSNGEFIYAVAEYYRYTRDVGFVSEVWPSVVRAVEYLAGLRQQRLTDDYTRPGKLAFYGLLPESISHEGYSSRPVHSYWDDFFALRGLKDAALLAGVVGDEKRAMEFAALRDGLRSDLAASIRRTMAEHKIDYIPASVELGDFDPTSTAMAILLGSEPELLPEPALTRTFERYYGQVQERLHAEPHDDAYTPYELRNVGALVRLGQRDRAVEILESIVADQRPAAWNQWPELLWHDPRLPRFIGDMPHTWVGAGFIQAVRTMVVYERAPAAGDSLPGSPAALVIAAGLPAAWVNDEGIVVKRLPTYYGILGYSLRRDGPDALRVKISGDLTLPPGGVVLQPPLPRPLTAVKVNGKPISTFTAASATINEVPAEVVMEWQTAEAAP